MDARQAGKQMQTYRKALKLTQDQVVAQSSVPSPQYLSALENGRYDIRNSEHFRSLVTLYHLTPAQVAEISPEAVITVVAPVGTAHAAPAWPARLYPQRDELYLPEGLQEAIDRFGDDPEYAALRDPNVQRQIALARGFDGGPQTAGEWLAFYLANRRWLEGPEH